MRRIFQRITSQENEGTSGRGRSLGLSWPAMLLLGLGLLCAVIWAFVMGFLVGRGHNPEAHLREMTGFNKTEEEKPQQPPVKTEIAATETPLPEETAPATSTSEKIATGPRFPEPSDAALTAWGEVRQEKPKSSATPPKPKKPEIKNPPAPALQHDYTYQLAAVRSSTDADNLKKKLQAKSVRAQVRKSGKVYLLVASFRGTDKTEQEMLNKIKAAGLGKPLRLSRKEATQKTVQKPRGRK